MKFDVELLKKHYFWILLGLSVPLILIALAVDGFAVPGTIKEVKDKADNMITALKNAGDVKNDEWVKLAKADADRYEKLKTVVWEQAWDAQKKDFRWPPTFEAIYHFNDGLFARTITVVKKEEVPAAEPSAKAPVNEKVIDAVLAEEKVVDEYAGFINEIATNSITVEGTKEQQFRKRDKAKYPAFDDLKENDPVKVNFSRDGRKAVFSGTVTKHESDDVWVKGATEEIFRNTGATTVTRDGNKSDFNVLKKKDPVKVVYQRGKYFGDVLSNNEVDTYLDNFQEQIGPILATIDPFNPATGQGAVQYRDWLYDPDKLPPADKPFFHYIDKKGDEWTRNKDNPKVISDEIWTLQENLWIQQEMYRLIRQANEQAAAFQCLGGEGPGPFTFLRPGEWRLDLKIVNNQLHARLTNLAEKRKLGTLQFQVRWSPDEPSRTTIFKIKAAKDDVKAGKDDVELDHEEQFPVNGGFRNVEAAAGAKGIFGVQEVKEVNKVKQFVDFECPGSASHQGPGPSTFTRPGEWRLDLKIVGRTLQARVTNLADKRKLGELKFRVRWGLDSEAKTTDFQLKYDGDLDRQGQFPRDGTFQDAVATVTDKKNGTSKEVVVTVPDGVEGVFGVQEEIDNQKFVDYKFAEDPFANTYYWANPYWRLKLRLQPDEKKPEESRVDVSIKNLSRYPQRVDVKFKFQVNDQPSLKADKQTALVHVQHDILKPRADEVKAGGAPLPLGEQVKVTGIYGVNQVLTWNTAAVKRLDQITIGTGSAEGGGGPAPPGGAGIAPPGAGGGVGTKEGAAHSHRTFPIGLQAFFKVEETKEAEGTPPGGGTPPGVPPGVQMPGKPGGGGGTTSTGSPNGLNFKRYSELSEQARRVPVALVLIVDQDQVGPVLASFSNSKMRFLTTQVLVNRYAKPVRPAETIDPKKFAGGGFPGNPTPPGGEGVPGGAVPPSPPGGNMPPGVPGGMLPGGSTPPGFPGGGQMVQQVTGGGGDDRMANVEVVIYGIASIYQRYPTAPAETTSSTPPAKKE